MGGVTHNPIPTREIIDHHEIRKIHIPIARFIDTIDALDEVWLIQHMPKPKEKS